MKLKKILLDESATNEEITRALNDGAMSELHLLAKEAKDEKDFLSKAKDFVKDQGAKFDGLEKMFKEFYSDMKKQLKKLKRLPLMMMVKRLKMKKILLIQKLVMKFK